MSDVPMSTLADDPGMRLLVQEFVADLPRRLAAIEQALAESNLELLCYLSHQLKGSAGTFGFAPITHAAAILEDQVRRDAGIEDLRRSVEALAALCGSVVSRAVGCPPSGA